MMVLLGLIQRIPGAKIGWLGAEKGVFWRGRTTPLQASLKGRPLQKAAISEMKGAEEAINE